MEADDEFPIHKEPLDNGDEFYTELADLVEEHEKRDEMDRERLLYACKTFGQHWIENMDITGKTW